MDFVCKIIRYWSEQKLRLKSLFLPNQYCKQKTTEHLWQLCWLKASVSSTKWWMECVIPSLLTSVSYNKERPSAKSKPWTTAWNLQKHSGLCHLRPSLMFQLVACLAWSCPGLQLSFLVCLWTDTRCVAMQGASLWSAWEKPDHVVVAGGWQRYPKTGIWRCHARWTSLPLSSASLVSHGKLYCLKTWSPFFAPCSFSARSVSPQLQPPWAAGRFMFSGWWHPCADAQPAQFPVALPLPTTDNVD